ncbi:MAG: DUF523 and DUF1722 domain-containing protein [Bryobacterales bacterium]|nr:DUF523 and DUF1722 domain-containing protein [Bryobacteraceae bacterium]MDW8354372.1 DUF523 and DUF1722 domain-containing protein [Bryobacterales bacterium]
MRVGISACLLGERVRWDGGHKREPFLTEIFGRYVEWVPVCPELEVGMGVPREPVRLVQLGGNTHMLGVHSGHDWTERMRRWAQRRVRELEELELCGFVLKKDSPSCGMERVRIYGPRGELRGQGRGLFAEVLLGHQPLLPVEEEGRLNDPAIRENFIERVFAYRRLRSLFAGRWTVGRLVEFQARHKLQIMAHSPQACRRLGRIVADAKRLPRQQVRERYETEFMSALKVRATARRHVNVLQHCLGYLRQQLDAPARQELVAVIEDYRRGLVPLVVPITMIRHYARLLNVEYLQGQVYLDPHPKELMLRNRV